MRKDKRAMGPREGRVWNRERRRRRSSHANRLFVKLISKYVIVICAQMHIIFSIAFKFFKDSYTKLSQLIITLIGDWLSKS